MSVVEKTAALLTVLTRADVEAESPAKRQRLADLCRAIADLADPPYKAQPPRSGVLYDLHSGAPRHE